MLNFSIIKLQLKYNLLIKKILLSFVISKIVVDMSRF